MTLGDDPVTEWGAYLKIPSRADGKQLHQFE